MVGPDDGELDGLGAVLLKDTGLDAADVLGDPKGEAED